MHAQLNPDPHAVVPHSISASQDVIDSVNAAIAALREVATSEDVSEIKEKTTACVQASMKIGEALSGKSSSGGGSEGGAKEGPQEAEYEEAGKK